MLKGFNSTTMDDIAQEAELSPATIYQYFRNKEKPLRLPEPDYPSVFVR